MELLRIPKLFEPNNVPGASMHSIKISVYCEQYLRDAPVIRNKYEQDLWSNLVSNLCHKFKGYSLSNGCCIFIYGKISCSYGMCRSVHIPYLGRTTHTMIIYVCSRSSPHVIPQIKRGRGQQGFLLGHFRRWNLCLFQSFSRLCHELQCCGAY